jgi:hypothetical protein
MKLSELTSDAQLIKITLDDEKIVEKYGETIEFWIQDRQDLDVYMNLAQLEGETDIVHLSKIVRKIVLDEKGKQILGEGKMLPFDIMIKVIEEAVKQLGNSLTQTLTT